MTRKAWVAWLALGCALPGCGSSGTGSRANGGATASGGTSAGGSTGTGGGVNAGGTAQSGGTSSGGAAGSVATGGHAGEYVIVPPAPGDEIQVELKYQSGSAASGNDVQAEIFLQNKILTSVLLNEIEIRYYLTLEGEETTPLSWAASGSIPKPVKCCFISLTTQMAVEVVTMPTPVTSADRYLKVTFTTDNSVFLRYTDVAELMIREYTNDPVVQSNDYSFNATTTPIVWDHITVYRNGKLVWGVEPS